MVLAALPFLRYFQFVTGSYRPLFQDAQVRGSFSWSWLWL